MFQRFSLCHSNLDACLTLNTKGNLTFIVGSRKRHYKMALATTGHCPRLWVNNQCAHVHKSFFFAESLPGSTHINEVLVA